MNTATVLNVLTTEQRQELLRDVHIPEEDVAAARRVLARHGADDLADMIGVNP